MIYRPVITGTAYLAQTIYAGSVPRPTAGADTAGALVSTKICTS